MLTAQPSDSIPRVPTKAMLRAADEYADNIPLSSWGSIVHARPENLWKVMYDAALQPSGEGEGDA